MSGKSSCYDRRESSLDVPLLNKQTFYEDCENVKLRISGTYEGADIYDISNVYTSSNLPLPEQDLEKTWSNYNSHLAQRTKILRRSVDASKPVEMFVMQRIIFGAT